QLLFDYHLGLVRRGLVGELLGWLTGETVSVGEIYLASLVISLAGAFAFFALLSRFLPQDRGGYLLMILALNTFAFASFIGNSGYLDGLLMALAALALWSDARSSHGLAARIGLVVAGVFVHENMLPNLAILIGFDIWLARRAGKRALVVAVLPVAAGALAVGFLAMFAEFSPDDAARFATHLQDKAAFRLDPASSDVAGRSMVQNFALMGDLRSTTKYWGWVLFDGVPLLAMSLWLIWLGLRVLGDCAGRMGRLLLSGAVVAPLGLNVIAFDVVRFGAVSVLAGFIVILLVIRHVPEAAPRLKTVLSWPLFLVLLVLNANMFTIGVNIAQGHLGQFPWVLLNQLKWLAP
ncbi:MAG: hypothetical protein ACE5DK_12330, partial [Paracoccaceae bacterium]